jgi:hypothetical protein
VKARNAARLSAIDACQQRALARRISRIQRMTRCALLVEKIGASRLGSGRKRHLGVTRARTGGESDKSREA